MQASVRFRWVVRLSMPRLIFPAISLQTWLSPRVLQRQTYYRCEDGWLLLESSRWLVENRAPGGRPGATAFPQATTSGGLSSESQRQWLRMRR